MGKRIDVKRRAKFSRELVVAREGKRLSQKSLAELVNVSRTTVTGWEAGRRIPTLENIGKLEEVLGVRFE